jgi:hypothetical protein
MPGRKNGHVCIDVVWAFSFFQSSLISIVGLGKTWSHTDFLIA